jgi:hypothetical protein
MRERRNVYKWLVGKLEGKRPLGRPRRRLLNNITMELVVIGLSVVDWTGLDWTGLDWTSLAQERYYWRGLVNEVMKF